jgi:hypothetical protein
MVQAATIARRSWMIALVMSLGRGVLAELFVDDVGDDQRPDPDARLAWSPASRRSVSRDRLVLTISSIAGGKTEDICENYRSIITPKK